MPVLDMSLERLKEYNGRGTKPVDFDEFWDSEVKKVHNSNIKYKFSPAKQKLQNVVYEDLFVTAPDGSRVYSRVARPNDRKAHPTVFLFHGKSGNCGSYCGLLKWVAAGFVAVSLECRSQGGYSDDKGYRGLYNQGGLIVKGLSEGHEQLYYKDVFLDIVRLVDVIKKQKYCDSTRLYAHGGSQGGALTVVCAALCPEMLAISPVYPFLCDYQRLYEMDWLNGAYNEIREYLRVYCPSEGEEREKMWNELAYIDIQYLAPRIKADTKWFLGLVDVTCPPSTQFAVYNKITAKKDMLVYTNHGHESTRDYDDESFSFIVNHESVR